MLARCSLLHYSRSLHHSAEAYHERAIQYLSGVLAPLTVEEEQVLKATDSDFAVITSSRNKAESRFLGPGRFANHDCEANSKLNSTKDGIQIYAVRNINVGEEIIVTYGSHYFGKNNCECLCATCESLQRNRWNVGRKEARISALISEDNAKHQWKVEGKAQGSFMCFTEAALRSMSRKQPGLPTVQMALEAVRAPMARDTKHTGRKHQSLSEG